MSQGFKTGVLLLTVLSSSARSHSWNNKLTLCLVFNEARNPREKMEEALAKWVEVIQVIKEDI